MSKKFLKSTEVDLINGGYLSEKSSKNPVYNEKFVKAQEYANYIMTFAELAKGKDFKGKKADTVEGLRAEVIAMMVKAPSVVYVSEPTEVERPTTDALAKEALAFVAFTENKGKAKKINQFMQQFNVLKEFEEFGLFFEQDVVKLKKIYTVAEIQEAVTNTIDLLS